MNIDNSTPAVVTGGASGLGAAVVRMLRERGAPVAIFDRSAERGEALAAETGALFCHCDITSDASVDAAFAGAAAAHGEARILVNCAGISESKRVIARRRDTGGFAAADTAWFERVIAVNLTGTFRTIARFSERLAAQPVRDDDGARGVIVNTASIAAVDGQIGQSAYSASKNGVVGMTLPLARDLARAGIRVMAILPGSFDTPLFGEIPADYRKRLETYVPFPPRLGKPAEFARLVCAIVENDMLNGESIRLDGAARMPPQ